MLKMVLNEIQCTIQVVESCRIYIESELFHTELQCLSYFNTNVTFPFLNCVEKCTQAELLVILPKLYEDLKIGETGTLQKYVVTIHGM